MAAVEEDVLAPWLPARPFVNFTHAFIEFENEGGRQQHVIECGHVVRTHDAQNCMVAGIKFSFDSHLNEPGEEPSAPYLQQGK